jgi:hypothetical protein
VRLESVLVVLVVAVGMCAPLFRVDWPSTHENNAYVIRTVEWVSELRAGHLFPGWCPDFYGGYGSPFFFFHGPIVYALAGLMAGTFLSPFMALKIVGLFGAIASGLGVYTIVYGETRRPAPAMLAGIAYLAAPYRLGNLYLRGDFTEYLCLSLLPFAIACYRAMALEPRPRRAFEFGIAAAFMHALTIISHAVMGLWGTALIGLIVAVSALHLALAGLRRRALLLVAMLGCAIGLAAAYVVPAIVYKSVTHTAGMVAGWYNPHHNYIPLHGLFDDVWEFMIPNMLKVGPYLSLALVGVVAGLVARFRRGLPALGWAALAFICVLLTQPVMSWFWVVGRVPFAAFIQFPWRLFGPAVLLAAVALGVGIAAVGDRFGPAVESTVAFACSGLFVLWIGWPFATCTVLAESSVPSDRETIFQGMYSATGMDEYLPAQASGPPISPRTSVVKQSDGLTIERVFLDSSEHDLTVRVNKPHATADLALHWFPGWKLTTLDGPRSAELDQDRDGLVRLRFPRRGLYHVRVARGVSPMGWLGAAISALFALGLALLLRSPRLFGGPVRREPEPPLTAPASVP